MKTIPAIAVGATVFALNLGEALLYYNLGRGTGIVSLPSWKWVGILAVLSFLIPFGIGFITDKIQQWVVD